MKRKTTIIVLATILLILTVVALLFYNGIVLFNNPSQKDYPVRGIDVSSYQGEIDWEQIANHNIQFAFIKATEGSSFIDPLFSENFEMASRTNLRIGAYHFFSYDSSGDSQADNFIATVPRMSNMLPPVVDFEFYGDKEGNLPDKENTQLEMLTLLQKLENYYDMRPIIYATEKSYMLYLAGDFDNYDIWIRNVISNPTLSDGRKWAFWQYTNREILDGYIGDEKYIDMNVFNGTKLEFDLYPNK